MAESGSKGLIGGAVGAIVAVGVFLVVRQFMAAPDTTELAPPGPPPAVVGEADADGFIPWEAPDGTFKLKFPGQPTKKTSHKPVQPKDGKPYVLSLTSWSVSLPEKGGTFMVNVTDIPVSAPDMAPRKRIDDARERSLKATGGKLAHEKQFRMSGYEGLDFAYDAEVDGKTVSTVQRIVSGRHRLYQVVAVHYGDAAKPTKFTQSFQMKMPGVAIPPQDPHAEKNQ